MVRATWTAMVAVLQVGLGIVEAQELRLDLPRADKFVEDDGQSITFTTWIWVLMVAIAGATSVAFAFVLSWSVLREKRKGVDPPKEAPEDTVEPGQRPTINLGLRDLMPEDFELVPQFSPDTKHYSAWIDEGINSIHLTAFPAITGHPPGLDLEKELNIEAKCRHVGSKKVRRIPLSSGERSPDIPFPKPPVAGPSKKSKDEQDHSTDLDSDALLSVELILKLGTSPETAIQKEKKGEKYTLLFWRKDGSLVSGKIVPELYAGSKDHFVAEVNGEMEEIKSSAVVYELESYTLQVHRRLNFKRLPTRSMKEDAAAKKQAVTEPASPPPQVAAGTSSSAPTTPKKSQYQTYSPPRAPPPTPRRLESIVKKDLRGGKPYPYTQKNVASKFRQ
eukprot:scaffold102_cov340-Pavlova_lutheri.AAC.32